jgi:hypothetical protein
MDEHTKKNFWFVVLEFYGISSVSDYQGTMTLCIGQTCQLSFDMQKVSDHRPDLQRNLIFRPDFENQGTHSGISNMSSVYAISLTTSLSTSQAPGATGPDFF